MRLCAPYCNFVPVPSNFMKHVALFYSRFSPQISSNLIGKLCFNFRNTFETLSLMLLLSKSLTWGKKLRNMASELVVVFLLIRIQRTNPLCDCFCIMPCRRQDPLLKNGKEIGTICPQKICFWKRSAPSQGIPLSSTD